MEKCRRMTNKDLSSIHRSPPRGPKRPRKPRGPSEPKAAASSLSAHVPIRSEKAVRAVGRKFTHTEVGASLPCFAIHRSAWKGYSPKFGTLGSAPFGAIRYSEVRRGPKEEYR